MSGEFCILVQQFYVSTKCACLANCLWSQNQPVDSLRTVSHPTWAWCIRNNPAHLFVDLEYLKIYICLSLSIYISFYLVYHMEFICVVWVKQQQGLLQTYGSSLFSIASVCADILLLVIHVVERPSADCIDSVLTMAQVSKSLED